MYTHMETGDSDWRVFRLIMCMSSSTRTRRNPQPHAESNKLFPYEYLRYSTSRATAVRLYNTCRGRVRLRRTGPGRGRLEGAKTTPQLHQPSHNPRPLRTPPPLRSYTGAYSLRCAVRSVSLSGPPEAQKGVVTCDTSGSSGWREE